jgi:sodium transport system permease protein
VKLAVVLSSVAFGVMHMFPQQVFNATLLGLVLGLLAIRSASLLPGIVFHIVYNGTEVLRNRVSADVWTEAPLRWLTFVQTVDPHVVVRYNLLCVGGCLVAALLLLSWLAGCWKPRGVGEPAPSESLARLGRSTPS